MQKIASSAFYPSLDHNEGFSQIFLWAIYILHSYYM